ncbi:hypothetical protein FQA47_012351 [Oryzias melastigma]|uniref:Uncharacterized protein n=1 Tax=Oryzias melastigma TaxID=30732 RepID=A0A834CEJ3_ORYME|nr:hypothetical protein FQA47_012351 [Oryzias melastigma]
MQLEWSSGDVRGRAPVPAPAAQTWSGRIKPRRSGRFCCSRTPVPCCASSSSSLPLSQERSRGEPSGLLAARRIILPGNPNGPLHESRAQSASPPPSSWIDGVPSARARSVSQSVSLRRRWRSVSALPPPRTHL